MQAIPAGYNIDAVVTGSRYYSAPSSAAFGNVNYINQPLDEVQPSLENNQVPILSDVVITATRIRRADPFANAALNFHNLSVEALIGVSAEMPQNNQSRAGQVMAAKMSDEEREKAAKEDERICRIVKTAQCWASAAERDAARVAGRPVPPLQTGVGETWSGRNLGVGLGGLAIVGGVACAMLEPCGAAVAAGLGIGGTAVILTQPAR